MIKINAALTITPIKTYTKCHRKAFILKLGFTVWTYIRKVRYSCQHYSKVVACWVLLESVLLHHRYEGHGQLVAQPFVPTSAKRLITSDWQPQTSFIKTVQTRSASDHKLLQYSCLPYIMLFPISCFTAQIPYVLIVTSLFLTSNKFLLS